MKCLEPTKDVILHVKELKIAETKTSLTEVETKKKFPVDKQQYNASNDFYTISMTKPLQKDQYYELVMEYDGLIRDGLAGYYKSSYFDPVKNKTKWLAVTQFQSIDARRAFPCFDEPIFKAKFKLTMGHHKDLTALSNMPVAKTTPM